MNNLTYFHNEARKSLQKCYLPATFSAMNSRQQNIPYFLRSFARKAKTEVTTEQSLASQNTDPMISVPSSVPSLSYATSHTYTRRNKFLISSEDRHQYALRKRAKEDSYRLINIPTLEKHVSSMSAKKEPKEIDSDSIVSATNISETEVVELPGTSENQRVLDEEEEKKLKAVRISNTVNRLRQWYYTDYGKMHQQSSQHGLEFTITSYNILAQELLEDNSWLYRHVESEVLEWDYRCRNLIRELRALRSDIICLQEVQSDHYESIFKPNFETLGYECLYKKRTGDKGDGCAVLFRKTMFTLIKCQAIEFNKPDVPLLDRDNVGLIVLLRPRGLSAFYDTHLCIATTHLLFNPRRGDVKLAQLRLLLAELDCLAFKKYCNIEKKVKYHPVILCGDMNSEPFSPLYDFICKGSLNCDSLLSGDISGQEEGANRGRILNTEELLHPDVAITESSQYSELQKSRQEKESSYFSNNSKETSWNEILTTDQSTQWPFDSIADSHFYTTETLSYNSESSSSPPAKSSSPPPAESSSPPPAESSSPPPAESSSPPPAESSSLPPAESSSPPPAESSSPPPAESSSPPPAESFSPPPTESSSSPAITICHYFNFSSAYTHFCGGKNEVTTHHSKANCTVDYIFYSAQSKNQYLNDSTTEQAYSEEGPLYHLGSYRLLNDTEMEELGGLPNSYQSSDHLSLASKFLLKFS